MSLINKKKGFTLVELLAVIVILAMLLVLALPSVLKATDNAKKSIFQNNARKLVNAAETKFQSDDIGGTPSACYKVSTLIPGTDSYKGCIVMNITGADIGTVKSVWIYNESFTSFATATLAATKLQVFYSGWCEGTSVTGATSCVSAAIQMPIFQIASIPTATVTSAMSTNCPSSCG